MSSGRLWQLIGFGAVAGGGYYLYNAGGDPKVAQKKIEADATKVSREVKSHLPGSATEIKKDGQVLVADAGKKMDDALADAKAGVHKVDSKLEGYRKEAERSIDTNLKGAEASAKSAVDKFDKNVTEGASKAKGTVSGWFGGSK